MNTKTILFAAAAVSAANIPIRANVDDEYDIYFDGQPLAEGVNHWNSVQDYNVDISSASSHMLAIKGKDYGGGIRVVAEINNQPTYIADWVCKGSNTKLDSWGSDLAWAQPDFVETDEWLPAGNANSGSVIQDSEAFWADGFSSQTTVWCRYHGNAFDEWTAAEPAVDYAAEHADLLNQIDDANDELRTHQSTQADLTDDLNEYTSGNSELHDQLSDLEATNSRLQQDIDAINQDHANLQQQIEQTVSDHAAAIELLAGEIAAEHAQISESYRASVEAQNQVIRQYQDDNHAAAMECQLNADGDSHQICTRVWADRHETW